MAIKVPNVGEVGILQTWINNAVPYARLYKNDYTPVDASVLGSFVQADFQGYGGGIACAFATVTTNAQGKAQSVSALLTWTFTGGAPQTIYGYFCGDSGGGLLHFAERAPTPILLSVAGDTVKLQITFTLESLS